MNEYKICHYDAKKILKRANKKSTMLSCTDNVTRLALSQEETKYDSQLFYQIRLELGETYPMEEVIIVLNFEEFSHSDYQEFKKYSDGVELFVNGKQIQYVDFLKSNSMSKNSDIYYINKELKDRIAPRVTFGFEKATNVPMAKWYAYSGLVNSNCHIIEGLTFTSDEIAIIADKTEVVETACISAISYLYLEELTEDYIDNFNDKYAKKRFECMRNSKNFSSLPTDMQDWINKVLSFERANAKDVLDTLLEKHKEQIEAPEVEWFPLEMKSYPLEINLFDGEGLIYDSGKKDSLISQINKALPKKKTVISEYNDETYDVDIYEEERENNYHSFQIRLPFIKGEVHACNFKKFFSNHGVKKIKGLYREYDVSKVKLILTESQFKGKIFLNSLLDTKEAQINYYFDNLKKYHYYLGISGLEPNKRDHQMMSYQYLSTLPAEALLGERTEEIRQYAVKRFRENLQPEKMIQGLAKQDKKAFEIATKVHNLNPDFYKLSQLYKDHSNQLYRSYIQRYQMSRFPFPAYRRLLCSDLLELLYHSSGLTCNKKVMLAVTDFYAPKIDFAKKEDTDYTGDDPNRKQDAIKPYYCLLFRNPHYSRNEIGSLKFSLAGSFEHHDYFSQLSGVIMQNPRSLIAERLSGADYDGDEIIISNFRHINQPMLEEQALGKNKGRDLNEPLVKIPSLKPKKVKSLEVYEEKVQCLEYTFKNKVGLISNIAFGKTFDAYGKEPTLTHLDIAFYTILGGLEIDSAKNGRKPNLSKYKPKKGEHKHNFLVVKDNIIKHKSTKGANFTVCSKDIEGKSTDHPLYYFYNYFRNTAKKEDLIPDLNLEYMPSDFERICKPTENLVTIKKMIFIDKVYSMLVQNFKHKDRTDDLKAIEDMIAQTLNLNEYDFDLEEGSSYEDFLEAFQTENPRKTLEQYFKLSQEYPYHFMTDDFHKRKFIEQLFGKDTIKEEYLDIIMDFDNNGFRLLYLLLRFNDMNKLQLQKEPIVMKSKAKRKDYINVFKGIRKEVFDMLSDDDLKDLVTQVNDQVSYLIELTSDKGYTKVSQYKEFFLSQLIELAKEIKFDDLILLYDWEKERIIFDVYEKQTLKFLEDIGGNL